MLDKYLAIFSRQFPDIKFVRSDRFKWDSGVSTIFYSLGSKNGLWSLFHELGHMKLGHREYRSDFSLLKMESQAWHKAREIASEHKIKIDSQHIEKCLDSYRDWLYARSSCRQCLQAGIEITTGLYRCINCSFSWKVSPQRFCRVYRRSLKTEIARP